MSRTLKLLAVAAAVAMPAIAGAQTVRVAGFGQGCYYLIGAAPCTNFSSHATSSSILAGSSLVYDGGSASAYNFDAFTSDGFLGIGGSPGNFGTLTTNNVAFNYGTSAPRLGFRLLVTFGQPSGIVGLQAVNATITGSTSTRGGGVFYNFADALQGPFAFSASEGPGVGAQDANVSGGAGELMTFGVSDLSVLNRQTASVTGNLTLQVTTPEPASLALMATGLLSLAGIGYARRRRNG